MNCSLRTTLLVVCACLMPVRVWAQSDHSNTYAWLAGQLAPNPEIHKRIVSAIDAQLAPKSRAKMAAVDAQKDPIPLGPVVLDVYDMTGKQLTWRGFPSAKREKKLAN